MKPIKRLLVGLDLTEMDEKLIRYAGMLTQILNCDTVYFVHIQRNLEIPEAIKSQYPDLAAPMDELIQHQIKQKLKEHWVASSDCETIIEVKEGNPADQIVRWTRLKSVDMMIMGKKTSLSGSGIVPKKIAKLLTTSLLFVPEEANDQLQNLFIPIDFSRFSGRAMHYAYELSKVLKGKLTVQYVYHVPTGYHKTGKSFDEFADIMRNHAQNDMKRFLTENEVPESEVQLVYNLNKDGNAATQIYETALNNQADLVVMSSKGRSGLASVMIGSVTEKMIDKIKKIPLLILKDEKENISFIDALLKI
jgi:nucleotide-binding universal stress UspA family protein